MFSARSWSPPEMKIFVPRMAYAPWALREAVVFALPFGFGSMRSAGSGARMTLGLMIGILYFFVQRTVASGTAVFNLDPLVLAWLPTALLALVATFLLVRVR